MTLFKHRLSRLRLWRRIALSALLVGVATFATIGVTGATPAFASTKGGPDCINQATTSHCYAVAEFKPRSGTAGVHLTFPFLPITRRVHSRRRR